MKIALIALVAMLTLSACEGGGARINGGGHGVHGSVGGTLMRF